MNALNAAKRRRAGITTNEPTNSTKGSTNQPANTLQKSSSTGLTIHQVVALFDKRILTLESTIATFMSASEDSESQNTTSPEITELASAIEKLTRDVDALNTKPASKEKVIEPLHSTKDIETLKSTIATLSVELDSMKSILLELQMYTMSVNKKLLEGISDGVLNTELSTKSEVVDKDTTNDLFVVSTSSDTLAPPASFQMQSSTVDENETTTI